MTDLRDIRLVDAGDGRRLEQLGSRTVDRPHPGARGPRHASAPWPGATLRFDRGAGWICRDAGALDATGAISPWEVEVGELRLELRAMPSGGVGFFPEQVQNVEWLGSEIGARSGAAAPPAVLNLFAHTGLLTLAAAAAGATVTHVDASRPAVAWARWNAELSGLEAAPIRWIVDAATAFCRREARRGRRYDGVILDPPSYGHAGGRAFALESGLEALLAACASVATPETFVLLSTHTAGIDVDRLLDGMGDALDRSPRAFETVPLTLEADTGAELRLGTAIRSRR